MYSHQASGHRAPNSNSALMYTYPPAPVPPARMHTTDNNQTSASRSRRSANHHNSSSTYLHPPHATWDAQYNQMSASRTRRASEPNSWSAYLAPPPSSAPAEPYAPATFATLPPVIPQHQSNASGRGGPVLFGGKGGNGGHGFVMGGDGGVGEGYELAMEDYPLWCSWVIGSGTGGDAGSAFFKGGRGGVGEVTALSKRLVPEANVHDPNRRFLTVAQFCREYKLGRNIRKLLEKEGYESAGSLFFASDKALSKANFKDGQICELRRALTEYNRATAL